MENDTAKYFKGNGTVKKPTKRERKFNSWCQKMPRWVLHIIHAGQLPFYVMVGIFEIGLFEAMREFKQGFVEIHKIDEE